MSWSAATPAAAAVQAAVYAAASGAGVAGGRVYDYVPEPATYPYVSVGEAIETPDNSHGEFGRSVLITVHVWSIYRGFAEALGIARQLVELLDHRPLTPAGHAAVAVRFEQLQTLRDPDPQVRHVPVQFRVITRQEQ